MHTSVAIGAFLLSAPAIAMPAGAPGPNTVTELEAETPAIGIHWSNEVQRGGDEMTIKLDNKTFITNHTFAATGFQANWNLDNCCFHGDDGEIKPTPIAPGSGSFNNYQISPPQIIRNVTCNEKPIENGNVFFVLTYENWGPPQALEVPHDGTAPNAHNWIGRKVKSISSSNNPFFVENCSGWPEGSQVVNEVGLIEFTKGVDVQAITCKTRKVSIN